VERAVKQRQRLRAVKDRLKAMHFNGDWGLGIGARVIGRTARWRSAVHLIPIPYSLIPPKWEPGRAIRAE